MAASARPLWRARALHAGIDLSVRTPNNPPITGKRERNGTPLVPLLASSLIKPASITVSPLCTAASVFIRRVLMRTLPWMSAWLPGLPTSCTMSRKTMPSRVTRGRTLSRLRQSAATERLWQKVTKTALVE